VSGLTWLASYPKSGNTWVRLLLQSLVQGGAPIDINFEDERPSGIAPRTEFDNRLGVDSSDLLCDEIDCARPRLYEMMAADEADSLPLKVHDAWTLTPLGEPLFPPGATAGAIYVVRDPRDVAISLAHHLGSGIDRAIDLMADSDARFGQALDQRYNFQVRQRLLSWSGHVRSWLDAPVRLHRIRYEDMVQHPVSSFGALARFLGQEASPEALNRAIAATRFEELRRQEDAAGFIERGRSGLSFFRRGEAGGWRDTLRVDQAARIEKDHGAVMAMLGYS
jgi:hypothetical protein